MKRFFAFAAALMLALSASAQGFIVKGGMNFLKADASADSRSLTSWCAGIGVQSYSKAGFSIQPELLYRVNGVTLADAKTYTKNTVELPVNIQWGIDLLVAKPFIFVSPFAGYNLSATENADQNFSIPVAEKIADNLEYGCGVGVGINIWKMQFTGKYNWTFGAGNDWDTLVNDIRTNAAALELSVGLKF